MFNDDLRVRVQRLLAGEFRLDDLSNLYLGLRDKSLGRKAFREIGDFVAHRRERDQGLINTVARDVATSFDVWSMGMRGITPEHADFARCARANLRLATDKQIKDGCKCKRDVAKKRLERTIERLSDGRSFHDDEDERVWRFLRGRWIWAPALKAGQLFADLQAVLKGNGLIHNSDIQDLEAAKDFITLHAIQVMHGSLIKLENDRSAMLYAGYANAERCLEVKIDLLHEGFGKPVWSPTCLFLTELKGSAYCEPDLILADDEVSHKAWSSPIEVTPAVKLDQARPPVRRQVQKQQMSRST